MDAQHDHIEWVLVEKIENEIHLLRLIANLDAFADENLRAELLAKTVDRGGVFGVVEHAAREVERVGIEMLGKGQAGQTFGDSRLDVGPRLGFAIDGVPRVKMLIE